MQYKQETEKVAMMNSSYMAVPKPLSLAEDREVQRTRKILIIILGVCLGLCVVALVGMMFGSALTTEMNGTQRSIKAGQAIIAILLYGFGIFVAHRYSAIGLRAFAWLNIIDLVLLVICIVILIIAMIMGYAAISTLITDMVIGFNVQLFSGSAGAQNEGVVGGLTAGIFIFILLICISSFVLAVIIVKLTFKLARAIDANQRLIIEQA